MAKKVKNLEDSTVESVNLEQVKEAKELSEVSKRQLKREINAQLQNETVKADIFDGDNSFEVELSIGKVKVGFKYEENGRAVLDSIHLDGINISGKVRIWDMIKIYALLRAIKKELKKI